MEQFLLCFVPLFAAVDALGTMPVYLSLTEGISARARRKVILESIIAAMLVSLAFLVLGKAVLRLMGITIADFMIAGGVLLFVISVKDMLLSKNKRALLDNESLGPVPLGIPLMVGPAVLTTSILLADHNGMLVTAAALVVNIMLAGVIFWSSTMFNRVTGPAVAKAISKLANILLASIAVMLIRKGFMMFSMQ